MSVFRQSFSKSWEQWQEEVLLAAIQDLDNNLANLGISKKRLETNSGDTCPGCNKKKLWAYDRKDWHKCALNCSSKCGYSARDIIHAISQESGQSYTEVMKMLSDQYGIDYGTSSATPKKVVFKPRVIKRDPVAGIDFDDPDALAQVEEVDEHLEMIEYGDPVDRYLQSRGINISNLPSAYSTIFKSKSTVNKTSFTIMACPLVGSDGKVWAYHRTFLTEEGKKAFKNAKLLTKAIIQGALSDHHANVPLAQSVDGVICLAEGIETALSLIQAGYPTIATRDASSLSKQVFDKTVNHILIFADRDASGTGQIEAANSADIYRSQGYRVDILLPPESLWDKESNPKGIDWNDVLSDNPNALD
jgi:hypothetical protein